MSAVENKCIGAGELAQCFSAHTALAEDPAPGSGSPNQITSNSNSRGSDTIFWILQAPALVCTYTYTHH